MARRTRREDPGGPVAATPGLFDRLDESGPGAYTVSQLTEEIRARVDGFGRVRVEGELSGWKRASSGHLYFDLKDEGARLACVIWRSQASRAVRFEPEEGLRAVAHGRLDVYPPRGSYSLIVDRLEPLGVGALLARLEELKRELRELGWFERHRPLPPLPRPVGVVTSRDGAALRDFLRTRSLRWPGYPVRLCHTPVQGPGAALEIAEAIRLLDRSGVDVIVVCRGGGSVEDLWAFNERPVLEAIWRASVPVVSGVGHESDTTLTDLVADHRAHTPTDAAQTVVPERASLEERVRRWGNFLMGAVEGLLARRIELLDGLARRPVLRDAEWILGERRRLLEVAGTRLGSVVASRLREDAAGLQGLLLRLERQSPRARLERWNHRLESAGARLLREGGQALEGAERRLAQGSRSLESISPLRVLARGYSLTRRSGDPTPLRDAAELAVGDEIETLFGRGRATSRVITTEPHERG